MPKISLWFLAAAAACMVAGVSMGIAMGIAHDFHLAPVHAHVNLLGWTSLALMGLTYRAWPELATSRTLALTQFILSAGSAVLFPVGIYLSIEHHQPMLAIVMAMVWLAGAVMFLVRVVALAIGWAPRQARTRVVLAAE
jgi:hypothetical protein